MLVDENGEPRSFVHKSSPGREGAQMTEQEMLGFAVDSLTAVFEEAGLHILATNKNPGWEYPHFIRESRNGKIYYVLADCFAFPAGRASSRGNAGVSREARQEGKSRPHLGDPLGAALAHGPARTPRSKRARSLECTGNTRLFLERG